MNAVREIISGDRGHTLARAHNALGRTSLHVAVLAQHEDVVDYLSETCPELLRVGDNVSINTVKFRTQPSAQNQGKKK